MSIFLDFRKANRLLLSVCLLVLVACESKQKHLSDAPVIASASPGRIPESEQPAGDPVKGYEIVTEGGYITCGLPYSVYKKSARPPKAADLLPGRKGRNADLPYAFTHYATPDGTDLVTSNCLTCHAAHFNGELIVGLGNENVDFTRDLAEAVEATGVYVDGGNEEREWRKWADRMQVISPYMITETIGSNPAINLTWALFAHHDPVTLAWSERPVLEPPATVVLPVSTPPWWRMRKKHAMFYSGEGRGLHARLMFLATSLCTDSVAEAEQLINHYGNDIRAYIAAIPPPRYPFAINADLAAKGRTVFESTCSRCHGTYGDTEMYPNLLVDLAEVGTDAALANAGAGPEYQRFYAWLQRSIYGQGTTLVPANGYVAPPLDGVWATAPYLHNGSVPTLAALLQSKTRPRYWTRNFDSPEYDENALGWRFSVLDHGKEASIDAAEKRRLYDTDRPGASNRGHTFGDGLTATQRQAVIEYIKTL